MTTAASSLNSSTPTHQNFLERNIPTNIVEKVFRIALGVFALMSVPVLFVAAFLFGASWAAVDLTLTRKTCKLASYVCSQGFLEQLSGVKIPTPVGIVADFAVKWVHIEHHPGVFAPLTGLGLGIWTGVIVRDALNKVL